MVAHEQESPLRGPHAGAVARAVVTRGPRAGTVAPSVVVRARTVASVLIVAAVCVGGEPVGAQDAPASAAVSCYPFKACLDQAREALARGEYELGHTLAWRAHQQGSALDATLLYLLARAQVLSGRAGGAIVTLERIARLGVATGVADDPDFAPVRALPDWPIVAAMFGKQSGPIESTRVALTLPPGMSVSGLVWDAVSRRWLLGSAGDARVLVVGEGDKRLSTLVGGAAAGFTGSIAGLAIDTDRGDLWVLSRESADGRGSRFHRVQLISGRPLASIDAGAEVDYVALQSGEEGRLIAIGKDGTTARLLPDVRRVVMGRRIDVPVAATTFDRALGGLLAASSQGLFRVDLATGRASAIEAAHGFSLDGLSGLCSNGTSAFVLQTGALGVRRVVRLHFGTGTTPTAEIIDQNLPDGSTPVACAVANGRLHYVARRDDGSYVIRALP